MSDAPRFCRLFLALLLAAGPAVAGSAAPPARIVVGPDLLVSRDGNFFHVEFSAAASSTEKGDLLVAAITGSRLDVPTSCRTYASRDGGMSWRDEEIPEQRDWGGADPQAAFGPSGTAYFSALTDLRKGGDSVSSLCFHRSGDGGRTWDRPVAVGDPAVSYDHDKIAVDLSRSAPVGRIYLAALYGLPYRIGVFASDDDGRTFDGPVDAAVGPEGVGINVCRPAVLGDGTLFLPFFDFPLVPRTSGTARSNIWFALSTDGGCTFSTRRRIGEWLVNLDDPHSGETWTDPDIAVDVRSGRSRDRIYAVWTDARNGAARVFFTMSADRGLHWTAARPVDPTGPGSSRQFQPTIAVNSDGVVAVAWLDTRNSADGSQYDEYLTASTDGGATFLSPRRISSESSTLLPTGNLAILPAAWRSRQGERVSFLAPLGRYEGGGDYSAMVADRDGTFHPFWPDGRTGTFQVWTCPVQVAIGDPGIRRPMPALMEITLDKEVKLQFDPAVYDATTSELRIPVRLENVSARTIRAPIRVRIEGFGSGYGDTYLENTPEILNSENGERGVGALFDFSSVLGDGKSLGPGAQSGALAWKLRLRSPLKTPDLHVTITGMVENPAGR